MEAAQWVIVGVAALVVMLALSVLLAEIVRELAKIVKARPIPCPPPASDGRWIWVADAPEEPE